MANRLTTFCRFAIGLTARFLGPTSMRCKIRLRNSILLPLLIASRAWTSQNLLRGVKWMTRQRKTILIVDDTPTNLGVISGALKDHFRTKVATSGERALAITDDDDRPDLILLDVVMPGMDGYEVCRRLKADPLTRDIPVIFLTAKTEVEDEKKGFELGAVDYIHKPFSASLVLARVATHIALQAALHEAHQAREEADKLLHCLLPQAAAEEIQKIGTVIPRRYENVAVLFADVVNFTSYCDRHEPEDVVSRLDALFVLFEQVTEAHGLEKIKTVGDAFMAAAGLLKGTNDSLAASVRCGLELSALSSQRLNWETRVGIHFGPVVAGVVGRERYQFDIWGDTVNVAARMAELGKAGRVALTQDVWRLIADRFSSESLGEIEIAGKGIIPLVEVWGELGLSR
jgi:adenylate cyclase